MPEPFMVSKAVDMSGSALGKATSVVIKGLLVLGLIAYLVWSAYVTFIKPHTNPTHTTEENAEAIYNYNYYPNKKVFGLGGTLWGMDIGVVKYSYPQNPTVSTSCTQEAKEVIKPVTKKKHWYFLWLA